MGSTPKEEFDTTGANSFLLEMTPIYIGGNNETNRAASTGGAPIYLNIQNMSGKDPVT